MVSVVSGATRAAEKRPIMSKHIALAALSCLVIVSVTACSSFTGEPDDSSTSTSTTGAPAARRSAPPTLKPGVDAGVAPTCASYDCPPAYECEEEHGAVSCLEHEGRGGE